jgi:hypothetical protein
MVYLPVKSKSTRLQIPKVYRKLKGKGKIIGRFFIKGTHYKIRRVILGGIILMLPQNWLPYSGVLSGLESLPVRIKSRATTAIS